MDDTDEVLPWIQLAGLIRFFAIAIEGAIEYAPDFVQPEVEFNVVCSQLEGLLGIRERLTIVCTNNCKPVSQRRPTDARYAGLHGGEIRRFIVSRFLQSLTPLCPKPIDQDTKYSITLEIDKPSWMILGTAK